MWNYNTCITIHAVASKCPRSITYRIQEKWSSSTWIKFYHFQCNLNGKYGLLYEQFILRYRTILLRNLFS